MITNIVADGGYILDAAAPGGVAGSGPYPAKADPLPASLDSGVYFGLDEAAYHEVHALSASGIKHLRISTLDFWARSPLNPDREDEEESQAKIIGKAYHKRIVEGRGEFQRLYAPAIDPDDFPNALRTVDEMKEALARHGVKPKGNKASVAAAVVAADPDALVWDHLIENHQRRHHGKTLLPADLIRRIEISAAMIERHPQLGKAFTGGYPEVSIFWTDQEFGVPMKARLDYLKRAAIIDLKTFENMNGMPVDKAIARTIANYKYHIQARLYLDAVRQAKRLIKEGRTFGEVDPLFLESVLASDGHTFMFVFQQKGVAPIARGFVLPALTLDLGRMEIDDAKRRFAECRERFGADPWVDDSEVRTFDSTEFPAYIGD